MMLCELLHLVVCVLDNLQRSEVGEITHPKG